MTAINENEHILTEQIKAADTAVFNGRSVEPKPEIMTITPELAREWLQSNTHNRPVKWREVKQFAGAMVRGEWMLNGDAIRFDYNGVLLDGQNRLYAIDQAKVSVRSLVIFNLPPEAQETMDSGAKRSLSDALKLRGETNTYHLATAIRWAFMYEAYVAGQGDIDPRFPPTTQQSLVFFEARGSRLVNALKEAARVQGKFRPAAPKSVMAVGWYIFHDINWEDTQDFYFKLGKGADLTENSPLYLLRRWLTNNQEKVDRVRTKTILAVLIKAWNAYRTGASLGHLRWVGGGAKPEPFPKAK